MIASLLLLYTAQLILLSLRLANYDINSTSPPTCSIVYHPV
jgi:hypothetical protein